MGTPRSIFFIGLDGAEPALVDRWMRDGSMPVLSDLHSRGVAGEVETLPGMGDGATWPTIVTGTNPARHGRYFRRQLEPGGYGIYKFDVDTHLKQSPFWGGLSDAGRKVAILDVPYTPTTSDLNGVCMVDWLIHDRYGAPRGYPNGFAEDVLARIGDDPVGGDTDRIPKDGASLRRAVDALGERIEMKERLVSETLRRGGWDFVATAFTEPHDIGHIAWHLHDTEHRDHDPHWVAQHGDPLRTVYQAIDTSIGRCLSNLEDDAVVVVFVGLGMGPNYTFNNVIQRALDRLEGKRGGEPFSFRKHLGRRHPPGLAGKLMRRASRLGGHVDDALKLRRLKGSRFFATEHNENSAAIRINLKGRESAGRVDPEKLDATCDELTTALMELVDPGTGNPVVKRVVRVADHFHGEYASELPDLMVEWNRETPFFAATSRRTGEIGPASSWGRSGDHTSNAMLIAAGPGVRPGRFANKPKLVDIAATVARLSAVDMAGLEGRAVPEIVGETAEAHTHVDLV